MNLNRTLRAKILEQFKSGASIAEIGQWYDKSTATIEQVVRDGLNGKVEKPESTLLDSRHGELE